jgi:transposase
LDVHFDKSQVCVMDANGKVLKEVRVRGHWGEVVGELGRLKEPFRVCYEASMGYGYLFEHIGKLPRAKQVVVAHPGQLRLIFKAKKKNDRVDARKLATLLYLDQVPQVHVPKQEVRSWRAMITWRQKLITRRVMAKNQTRALLKTCGLVPPKGKKLWSRAGIGWIKEQELPTAFEKLRRDMLLEELVEVNQKVSRVEEALGEIAGQHPGVQLLMTIPGVGQRTAEAFVAYVDEPWRFGNISQAGAYFGLVPCQDASASKNRLGHVTKDGPAVARKLLVEATWQGTLRSEKIRGHFEQIVQGKRERRKIALVGTARWLSTVMLSMLKSGECWREEVPAADRAGSAAGATAAETTDPGGESEP